MVGNLSLCLCLWLGWWEICCHPVARATSPCWGWSCWLWLLCVTFVEAQGTSELKCSSLALASLKQLLYRGGILRVFLHAVLVSYITLLNWDFTFLLITWERFLLLGLLGAVPWAVLIPVLLQSNEWCDLCVYLPPPVITERLLGGRTWIRAEFHRPCSTHPGISCLAASGCSSNWCLAAWIGDCKALYYIFLCASLSQLLQCELQQPGLEASLESSVLQELSWGLTWCICHCCALFKGLVGSAKPLPFLLFSFTKTEGCNENYFNFSMSLPCCVILSSYLGNTETSFPKFGTLHLQTEAELTKNFTSLEDGDWKETGW